MLVWVARTFTDQHRAALDWLNEVSKTGTRFFGLEIELWQIGDSVPAPKFNVVAKPNDWTKDGVDAAALTDTQRMQLRFWEGFAEFVSRKGTIVKKTHAPRPHNWLGMVGVGRGGSTGALRPTLGILTSVPSSTAGSSKGSKRSTSSWRLGSGRCRCRGSGGQSGSTCIRFRPSKKR